MPQTISTLNYSISGLGSSGFHEYLSSIATPTLSPLNPSKHNRIVVIGASAGGHKVLESLLTALPGDFPFPILVVIHQPRESNLQYVKLVNQKTELRFKVAEQDEPIQNGIVYFAPSKQHLLVKKDKICLSSGPFENNFRPAIDPLFRSAAVNFGPAVIGVLLSGMLNDGSSGMVAIQKCGGYAIVQDPLDAEYPEMPASAMRVITPDRIGTVEEIVECLMSLEGEEMNAQPEIPEELRQEVNMTYEIGSHVEMQNSLGDQVPFGCPDCGGPLWQMKDENLRRYRCHVGHAFTAESLLDSQDRYLTETLWASLRMFEERANLLDRLVQDYVQKGFTPLAETYKLRAEEAKKHIQRLKSFMSRLG